MIKVVCLGPSEATFSALAYEKLAKLYGAPSLYKKGVRGREILAERNEDVIPLMLRDTNSFGVLAMETSGGGRIDPPMNSFIKLLDENPAYLEVVGAVRMRVSFCLMARPGITLENLEGVLAHPEALLACRERLAKLGIDTHEAKSNGFAAEEAARLSASHWGALAPSIAAKKFGLDILQEGFEDRYSVTTFFLLRRTFKDFKLPDRHFHRKRGLVVFKIKDEPGALIKVLTPFAERKINLSHIHSHNMSSHSFGATGKSHGFAIEAEFPATEEGEGEYRRALYHARVHMMPHIEFGPFPIEHI